MCGVAGILGGGDEDARTRLAAAMGDALRHRGPDAGGAVSNGPVSLAHRRLAVVDLSEAGAQPMASSDGRWLISYNGEIYNHAFVRAELDEAVPRQWRGHSDTETLIEAIAHWGLRDALARCDGMFAFALWDSAEHRLTLVRDRTGEKPMYVGWLGEDIVFGSELRSLRRHTAWRGGVEPKALDWMLTVGYVPAPWSIHPGVFKLPAGALIELVPADTSLAPDAAGFTDRIERFWTIESELAAAISDPWLGGRADALDALQATIDASVETRMLADVPVGALLSGGIDSSIVVASMAARSSHPVHTFTVAFERKDLDESEAAASTARHLGTRHERIELGVSDALAVVERMPDVYDEPFADAAQLPALLVSEVARSFVTVALTGDGGDELFHGYQRYLDGRRSWHVASALQAGLRTSLAACMRTGASLTHGAVSAVLARQSSRIGAPDTDAYIASLMSFTGTLAHNRAVHQDPVAWPRIPAQLQGFETRARFVDQVLALAEGIHCKLDRASMSVALELRTPLLSHDLLGLAWRMPLQWHRSGREGKSLLRELAERRVPGVSTRRKHGFDVPVGDWLRGPLRGWAVALVRNDRLCSDAGIDAGRLACAYEHHLARRGDNGRALWSVLMYLAWYQRHE